MTLSTNSALVGHTGFVGNMLLGSRNFSGTYNSRNLGEITNRAFDIVICAGAPATMWAANQDPAADKANLDALGSTLRTVDAEHLVLISTIAVFDDLSAGYDERRAGYEVEKAYGRHRREFEERLTAQFPQIHILRLPALFGKGLKKNFVFDVINPMPSFLRPDRFAELERSIEGPLAAILAGLYREDAGLNMRALDRPAFERSPDKAALTSAVQAARMHAAMFTNSRSRFQYYDLSRLADDIERVIADRIDVINICSEPISAGDIHAALTGLSFDNDGPPVICEDVHSVHADLFGGPAPYLFDRADTLARLQAFYRTETR